MSRYAIGDIHGGLQTFQALIRRISPRHGDRVYLLGDYIDRGSDSKGVLDAIISMQEAGCDIRPLRGNHDDMLLRSVTGDHDAFSWHWVKGWGSYTLQSFGVQTPSELPDHYVNFLASLPFCYKDEDYLLVHAGLDMTKDDPLTETEPAQMLWGDASYLHRDTSCLKSTTLVTGHKIRTLDDIVLSCKTSHICLDNGAFTSLQPEHGNLLALNLDTLDITLQPWLDGKAEF